MTDRPTRATVAGCAYLDLQNLARKQGRPTDELHQMYALEGFSPASWSRRTRTGWFSRAACCWPRTTPAPHP